MALEIKNFEFCRETLELKSEIEVAFVSLGERLKKIRDDQLYLGQWDNFAIFLEEAKISVGTASKLINLYEKFVFSFGIEPKLLVEAGGWSVVAETLPLVKTKEDALYWLDKARLLSKDDLRLELKEAKTGKDYSHCTHEDCYTIRVCRACGDKQRLD